MNFGIAAEGIDISEDAINRSSVEIRSLLKVGDISHCKNCDTKIKIPKSAILFEIEER